MIPQDSFLRDISVVGTTGITTISGISTGYYFTVYNSNVGKGVTSLHTSGTIIGIGTTFLDNVYRAMSVSIAQTSVIGMGVTYVARVIVSVSGYNQLTGIGYSNFFGNYSWGRISLDYRQKQNSYSAYPIGISTGTIVNRKIPSKAFYK